MADHPTEEKRESNGRFQKGHSYSKGPRKRQIFANQYLYELTSVVTLARWRNIVEMAATQAEQGDDKARTFLAHYAMGKPVEQLVAKITAGEDALTDFIDELRGVLPDAEDGE